MKLPGKFLENMKELLGKEYEDFLRSYEQAPKQGLRLNSLKCSEETLCRSLPFPIQAAPFSPLSYYGPGEKVGALPAHHAGMFYSQEPSAASAVTLLEPKPGEKILDLCAAPGGKSTQIAALLQGQGLLWSNEIVRGRANSLLSNLERMGVKNAVASSCHPERLCAGLSGYFDRVLVDAPCSGEGMFRRDPQAAEEWTVDSNRACAQRQGEILDSASLAVKGGGILVYSTCTFSKTENEAVVQAFLERHPEFEPSPVSVSFGRPALEGVSGIRIFPMDGGEGHFVAKLRRREEGENGVKLFLPPRDKELAQAEALWKELFSVAPQGRFYRREDKFYLLPAELPEFSGLGVLRAGVEIALRKGMRLEPTHGLFMSMKKEECRQWIDFSADSPELLRFLKGEEIACEAAGYTAVCVNGVVTGFGKASGGRLKNRYPKGLRLL